MLKRIEMFLKIISQRTLITKNEKIDYKYELVVVQNSLPSDLTKIDKCLTFVSKKLEV